MATSLYSVVTAAIRMDTKAGKLSAQLSRLDGQLHTLNTFLQSRGQACAAAIPPVASPPHPTAEHPE